MRLQPRLSRLGTLALLALISAPAPASAQECNHECPRSRRDARGCCPAPRPAAAPSQRHMGAIYATTDGPSADVLVDGRPAGTTPLRVDGLSPGDHAVELRTGGRTVLSRVVAVTADHLESVSATVGTPAASAPAATPAPADCGEELRRTWHATQGTFTPSPGACGRFVGTTDGANTQGNSYGFYEHHREVAGDFDLSVRVINLGGDSGVGFYLAQPGFQLGINTTTGFHFYLPHGFTGWSSTSAIVHGGENELRVHRAGQTLTAFINGQLVSTLQITGDPPAGHPRIGFSGPPNARTQVEFRDFRLSTP